MLTCSVAHPGCRECSCIMVGGVVWRAVHQSGVGRCTKEGALLHQVHCNAFSAALHRRDNPTHPSVGCTGEGAPAKCSKVLSGSIMSGGISVTFPPLLLLLLQLSLTLRMVAEKWPHKKAIKEHKGSEFRAQCDISRKWDICVHGARPTFDMFTRVQ